MVMFSVICFLCFYMFFENWSFPLAFIVRPNGFGGSGGSPGAPSRAFGPLGAMMRYQIVTISLVLKV